jgi:ankyrin repeat protein
VALHHALARSNDTDTFALLLAHGADPSLVSDGLTGFARAAREGRYDVLNLFERRGIAIDLQGVDELIAACARDDKTKMRAIGNRDPLVRELIAMGGTLLARFASNWNLKGVQNLLDLGVDPAAPFKEGDGYFGIPENSLPIHVAAWRAQPKIVKLLIKRGSPVDVPDANGNTPLALAVRACVDSYWSERRSPESVKALLAAGAATKGVPFPSGYDEVDALLRAHAS